MAIRNSWLVPAAIFVLIAVLAIALLRGVATAIGAFVPRQPATNVLRVPGSYPTIQAAVDAARAGDIIEVEAGTYTGTITLNKPVSLTAATFDQVNAANNTTILDGANSEATILIPGGLAQMPSIHGFVIRNSTDGIEANSQFVAENNYFYGSQWAVEYLTGSGGANRNNIYFNSANDAIHISDFSMPLLIENNRFMYAGDDGIEVDLQGTSAPPNVLEMDIWNNMLIGSSQDGIKLVDYATNPLDTNRRFVIAGNLIANNRRAGIGLMHSGNTNEDYSGTDTAEAVRAFNNTFYGNDYGISGGDNLVTFNNIIANTTSRGAWRVQGPNGANSVVAYTLFWGNRVDTDQTTLGPGNIFGQDPLFMAAPGPGPDGSWGTVDDDFSGLLLQQGSPAIDKGVTQYVAASGEPVPATPLTGFTGAAPDLGWREFGSPIFITPTPIVTPFATVGATATGLATATPPVGVTNTPAVTGTAGSTATPGTPTPASPTPGTPVSPTASPTGATATQEGTTTPQLTIQGIAPTSATAGQTVLLTITGTGFQDGAAVAFEGADGTPPQVSALQVSGSTTITLAVTTPDSVSGTQKWDVRVTNPDGSSAVLTNAFTVTQ